jgi:hypothetical protein
MKIQQLQSNIRSQKGYTLLFAVITAALVLGVAVFILSVSKKQYALSVAARDSIYSLYAADSAMECVAATNVSTSSPLVIRCNNNNSAQVNFTSVLSDPNPPLDPALWPTPVSNVYRALNVLVVLDGGTCALVSITDGNYTQGTLKHKTIVESRGYNYCDSAGPKVSQRTVERALRLTYR